ncbi:LysR family transcriptional regulator, partial [Aeromonas veronii]|uniref:LysR family transcriptional regulator n=1 Tax=Aeromonas veronii TaxID=654 RepID=UPI003BA10B74
MDKHLRQFIAVATHKNVSLAARKMGLSQPTLTHNMKKLEENLGTANSTSKCNSRLKIRLLSEVRQKPPV